MVFPRTHVLIAFGGTLRQNEIWSGTLRLDSPAVPEQASVANTLAAAWNSVDSPCGMEVALGWVKVNQVGTDGTYIQQTTNLIELADPAEHPTQASPYPNQVSLVATLNTPKSRGLAHRGRLFLPLPRYAIDGGSDGRITPGSATAAATWLAGLIGSLNALSDGNISVFSKVREGAAEPVSEVIVGRVLDTMRSRRSALDEFYSAPVGTGAF